MTAPDQERELEAALARMANRAVPDDAPVPAPPWRTPRRSGDLRRFGRATPWLVAAVLLVLAGLGIGAGVAFEASPPDRHPVATEPPGPSATATSSDGTLGDVPTAGVTPSAGPSLDRNGNTAGPNEDSDASTSAASGGPYVAGIGTFGPIKVGMNESEAMLATGISEGAFAQGPGTCTSREVPKNGQSYDGMAEMYALDGSIIGIQAAGPDTDSAGNGVGTTLARLRSTYPAGEVAQTGRGWTFAVLDGSGNGLGFNLAVTGSAPADTDTVAALFAGTADFARGFELCSG